MEPERRSKGVPTPLHPCLLESMSCTLLQIRRKRKKKSELQMIQDRHVSHHIPKGAYTLGEQNMIKTDSLRFAACLRKFFKTNRLRSIEMDEWAWNPSIIEG
ncbi:hypothetical protein AVEN_172726-1 [Araneus ventricosus]|uniref:Uncharacterized protein n=1 Tax=Araneus ventricosus TaxID=182803 RepID=A0A4Y2VGE2_ARAVE|nr:hypothetical protein AVEN_172726-1 [Araneus ventricosus]